MGISDRGGFEGGREEGNQGTGIERKRREKMQLHGNQDDRQIASMTWFAKTN
jgi:hypothetical protein